MGVDDFSTFLTKRSQEGGQTEISRRRLNELLALTKLSIDEKNSIDRDKRSRTEQDSKKWDLLKSEQNFAQIRGLQAKEQSYRRTQQTRSADS